MQQQFKQQQAKPANALSKPKNCSPTWATSRTSGSSRTNVQLELMKFCHLYLWVAALTLDHKLGVKATSDHFYIVTDRVFVLLSVECLIPEGSRTTRLNYCAVKKVFLKFSVKFFEVFARIFEVLASFLRLSDGRTDPDPFGPIGTHSDAFGSIRKRLDVFDFFF